MKSDDCQQVRIFHISGIISLNVNDKCCLIRNFWIFMGEYQPPFLSIGRVHHFIESIYDQFPSNSGHFCADQAFCSYSYCRPYFPLLDYSISPLRWFKRSRTWFRTSDCLDYSRKVLEKVLRKGDLTLVLEYYKFPHPSTDRFMNFVNSTGFAYEAMAVRQARFWAKLCSWTFWLAGSKQWIKKHLFLCRFRPE